MSGFQDQTASATTTMPDPYKHVQYSLGMVLGVDDFDQEFAYLANRDQWLARDTLGYGTVCGLQVKLKTDERGPRIEVEPGVAINPRGQLIRVTPAQCCYLNDWLTAQRDEVVRQVGSPVDGQVTLYVVLCYRDCPTDPVPIPGEPCRDETEATTTSRFKDDFELKLSLTAPDQAEENAVRDFVAWLRQIEISDTADSMPLAEFLAAIRNATYVLASPPATPPSPPDFLYGSPPSGWAINSADACEYLRAALRVWVTELRPLWRGAACDGSTPDEACVLLAELEVPLLDGLAGNSESVVLNEARRPFLVHVRLLQEWLTCGPHAGGGGPRLSPAAAVVTEEAWGQTAGVGALIDEYALADHTHGTPPDPIPPHQADPFAHELQGDVTGPTGNTRVEQIQGVAVDPNAPTTDGQVLTYDAGARQWTARAPAGGTATGDFVEHPTKLSRYFIVAAGIAKADGSEPTPPWAPDYNGLNATAIDTSRVLVRFDNFAPPADKHQYIIKAMPVFNADVWAKIKVSQPVVNFERFVDEGILLYITNLGRPIEKDPLAQLTFVIEVSQYPELPN